jgi:hypothetical protein
MTSGQGIYRIVTKAKPKLSVELAILPRDLHVARFSEGVEADPLAVLRNARVRPLSDAEKPNYLVIKFSYLVRDPETGGVAAFSRVKGRHASIVADHSTLLSAGVDNDLGAIDVGGTLAENATYPLMRKMGGLVGSLELTPRAYKGLPRATRCSAWVVRVVNGKNYLFLIHVANLLPGAPFPRDTFPLRCEDPKRKKRDPVDEFKGFFSVQDIDRLLDVEKLPVDRFALMLVGAGEFEFPGDMRAGILAPLDEASGITSRIWKSLQLKPGAFGLGIDLKELFGSTRREQQ